MLNCINNSGILKASLELLSNDDYDINNEFKTMCTRFGLNETQMISLVTTLDISLLSNHYETIWDGLNYYSMACMDDYKKVYIESLYKTDLMDPRIELLCDDLKEYIKCNTCINIKNKCSTFREACKIMHHDTCVKYLINNPQKHDVKNDMHNWIFFKHVNIIDYICMCGGLLDVVKYLFEIQKKYCTTNAIDWASFNGNLDVVKYLFEIQKKDCTDSAINNAINRGHLDVVKYLFEIQKKDCIPRAINRESEYGHFDMIKYLREIQNTDCTINAIDKASKNGHLDIVKYLFEIQNKDCTTDAINNASLNGHLSIIKYLFEVQNKDCTTKAIDIASQNGHLDVIKYLFEIQKKDCTNHAIKYAKNNTIRDYVKKMKKKL